MRDRYHRRRRPVSKETIERCRALFRYSYSRDAYILRGVGSWMGPVLRLSPVESSEDTGAVGGLLGVVKVDFAPRHEQPSIGRLAVASVIALVGSLLADKLLVSAGTWTYPALRHYPHFQFHDYARLTIAGVLAACVGWPIVTRISSAPRWLFFRLAIAVTLVLFVPDAWIFYRGQPADAVGVLLCMHVAIALVTYNALVRIARTGRPSPAIEPVRPAQE
jgi:hypothetical protein